jgi:hypothetical protein
VDPGKSATAFGILDRVTPTLVRSPSVLVLAGAACLILAGCGTQTYKQPSAAPSPPASLATMSKAQSLRFLESERSGVARQYWPATSVVMKAVPGMESRLQMGLRFEEAFGTYAACDVWGGGTGLHYLITIVIEASGRRAYEDLGPPLGQAALTVERDLTRAGWGPFRVSQGVWVAGKRDGVSANFDNNPSATESEHSSATALVYTLTGTCVPVPGVSVTPPGGGSQAGGGPDAGPPPGDASAGDGLPPVYDSYGLGPASLPPLAGLSRDPGAADPRRRLPAATAVRRPNHFAGPEIEGHIVPSVGNARSVQRHILVRNGGRALVVRIVVETLVEVHVDDAVSGV